MRYVLQQAMCEEIGKVKLVLPVVSVDTRGSGRIYAFFLSFV
jgi:hypothetical protein